VKKRYVQAMNNAPIDHLEPERRFQELMREFLQSYFGGTPHKSPAGDVTFHKAGIFFNQQPVAHEPSIQCSIINFARTESWIENSKLPGLVQVLASPASGVDYVLTTDGAIAECVHGAVRRTIAGTQIRWQASGPNLLEQTLVSGSWTTQRTITGTSSLSWTRDISGNYLERTSSGTTARTIVITDPLWDGAKKRVCLTFTTSWFIRVPRKGSGKDEQIARAITSQLNNLLTDTRAFMSLQEKGFKSLKALSDPHHITDDAAHVWFFTTDSECECRRPIELA
jgi:hypothetical protein